MPASLTRNLITGGAGFLGSHLVDKIWHLACPASPVHYQFNPIKTAKTSFLGTYNMLSLASTNEANQQPESYHSCVKRPASAAASQRPSTSPKRSISTTSACTTPRSA